MPKSKFFRVAVEGQTTDGRTIERNWLEEMAASYNPETYAARINMEHIRGYSADAPFKAYGDVLALKTETIELELDGKVEKRLALFAQVDATDDLVALNKQRQKLYTSCEIAPSFAGTGKAYLVGLAVTDSPASLGTEMLAFAAGRPLSANPLGSRKQDANNVFSAADASELELELAEPTGDVKGLVQLATEFFSRFTAPTAPPAPAPVAIVAPPATEEFTPAALAGLFQKFGGIVEASSAETRQQVAALSGRVEELGKLTGRVDELATKLNSTPAPTTPRPIATGGGNYARTDC